MTVSGLDKAGGVALHGWMWGAAKSTATLGTQRGEQDMAQSGL